MVSLAGALLLAGVGAPSLAEVSVRVNADDSVLIKSGYDFDKVIEYAGLNAAAYKEDVSRVTVLFPEETPAIYERESNEDYPFVVDGFLPDDADIVMQAFASANGSEITAFQHTIRGGQWVIEASYMAQLPAGGVEIQATLRTPGHRDVVVTHPFYILTPGNLADSDEAPWFDWEQEGEAAIPPILPGEGFMEFEPSPDSRIYYVSEAGSDSNDGLTKQTSLRSLKAAYEKIRDNSADWILLKAGDSFEGGFGYWGKSGISVDQPLYVGVYGEGNRPRVETTGEGFLYNFGHTNFLTLDGIHAVADRSAAEKENGITFLGRNTGLVLHDMHIENFSNNVIIQGLLPGDITNVVIFRCIVNNAFNSDVIGHAEGIYAANVNGLQIVECTFDRNGWHPTEDGAHRTVFNHNLYIQSNCENVAVRGSVITRGASHGLQLRPGGDVMDNLFVANAMAFFVVRADSKIVDNVVMSSDNINNSQIRGHGIEVKPCENVLIANNIIKNKVGDAGWMPAIEVKYSSNAMRELDYYHVTMYDNIVWNWWMAAPNHEYSITSAAQVTRRNNTVDGACLETGERVVYADPSRDFDSYVEGGLAEFLRQAVLRPRGSWNEKFSANGFNEWMREGFTPVEVEHKL